MGREQASSAADSRSFKDQGSEDIFHGADTKAARKTLPTSLQPRARRTLDQLNAAISLRSLTLPGTDSGPDDVEIVDYH